MASLSSTTVFHQFFVQIFFIEKSYKKKKFSLSLARYFFEIVHVTFPFYIILDYKVDILQVLV